MLRKEEGSHISDNESDFGAELERDLEAQLNKQVVDKATQSSISENEKLRKQLVLAQQELLRKEAVLKKMTEYAVSMETQNRNLKTTVHSLGHELNQLNAYANEAINEYADALNLEHSKVVAERRKLADERMRSVEAFKRESHLIQENEFLRMSRTYQSDELNTLEQEKEAALNMAVHYEDKAETLGTQLAKKRQDLKDTTKSLLRQLSIVGAKNKSNPLDAAVILVPKKPAPLTSFKEVKQDEADVESYELSSPISQDSDNESENTWSAVVARGPSKI